MARKVTLLEHADELSELQASCEGGRLGPSPAEGGTGAPCRGDAWPALGCGAGLGCPRSAGGRRRRRFLLSVDFLLKKLCCYICIPPPFLYLFILGFFPPKLFADSSLKNCRKKPILRLELFKLLLLNYLKIKTWQRKADRASFCSRN